MLSVALMMESEAGMEKKSFLNNRLYDILKWCAILFLPALAILIQTVFSIWGIPFGEQISSTIIALQVFLGAVLGISSMQYNREVKDL